MGHLACNIDRRGRTVRALSGGAMLALAIVVAWLGLPIGGAWTRWILTGLLALAGLFQVFEAWRGWCGVRALGIRTPL